jgi:hypothetical protein
MVEGNALSACLMPIGSIEATSQHQWNEPGVEGASSSKSQIRASVVWS